MGLVFRPFSWRIEISCFNLLYVFKQVTISELIAGQRKLATLAKITPRFKSSQTTPTMSKKIPIIISSPLI